MSEEIIDDSKLEEKIELILNDVNNLETETLLGFSIGFHLGCYLSENDKWRNQFRERLETILNNRTNKISEENKLRCKKILELGELALQ